MKLPKTYTVSLSNMCFYTSIGVGEDERSVGEKIIVDTKLTAILNEGAFADDDFTCAPDYSAIYDAIKQETSHPAKLLEHMAWRILKRVLEVNGILAATITVTKPNPPIASDGASASVTVSGEI